MRAIYAAFRARCRAIGAKLKGQARETPRRFIERESHYPAWREARAELNELPLGPEAWRRSL